VATQANVVAFLRAINVGGRFIKMDALSGHFQDIGLSCVSTHINSGNVLFHSRAQNLSALAARIEPELQARLGFQSEVFLRQASRVQAIAEEAASLEQRLDGQGEVNVAFLSQPLSDTQWTELQRVRSERDDFAHSGQEVYWICRGKQMESRFSNAVMERRLRLRCTFRRASMLQKLSARLQEPG
jgi:uncharacterized protein (DUF1697 family)